MDKVKGGGGGVITAAVFDFVVGIDSCLADAFFISVRYVASLFIWKQVWGR